MAETPSVEVFEAAIGRVLREVKSSSIDELPALLATGIRTTGDLVDLREQLELQAEGFRDAARRVSRLVPDVASVAESFAMSEAGWPQLEGELESAIKADPAGGIKQWFRQVMIALSYWRLGALDRLTLMEALSEQGGARLLVDSCRATWHAFHDRRFELVGEPVRAVVRSGALATRLGVPADSRARLAVLLARLATWSGFSDEADVLLSEAEGLGGNRSDVAAVRAWQARRRGDPEAAAMHLSMARSGATAWRLAALVEAVAQAATIGHEDPVSRRRLARSLALDGVNGLPSVIGIEGDLDALLDVPPEIWLAIGLRAVEQGYSDVAHAAFERAVQDSSYDDYGFRAEVYQAHAGLLEQTEAPVEEIGAKRQAAGRMRLLSRRPSSALKLFESALELRPDDAQLALQIGDAVVVDSWQKPLSDTRERFLAEVQRLTAVRERSGLGADHSWGYLVWSDLEVALSDSADSGESRRLWSGLEAAALAVAHSPTASRRWAKLADVADTVEMIRVAKLALAMGRQLRRTSEDRGLLECDTIRVAANLGDFGFARSLMPDIEEAGQLFVKHVSAYIDLREGDASTALALIPEGGAQPEWAPWVWHIVLDACILDGDGRLESLGKQAAEAVARHPAQRSWLSVATYAHLVAKSIDAATEVVARSRALQAELTPSGRAPLPLGAETYLLAGDREAGLSQIRADLAYATSPRTARDWSSVRLPVLQRHAARYGIELPDLGEISDLCAARAKDLDCVSPDAEIDTFPFVGPDLDLSRRTCALLRSLVALARGDADPIAALIDRGGLDHLPEAERGDLRAAVEGSANQFAAAAASVRAVTAAGNRDVGGTEAALVEALHHGADETSDFLKAADPSQAARETLSQVLGRLTRDRDVGAQAHRVRACLDWAPAPHEESAARGVHEEPEVPTLDEDLEWPIVVELPESWFADHEDPGRSHPIFTRYLPLVRVTASHLVPPVKVRAEAELEPKGYRILVEGKTVEEGSSARQLRYVPSPAAELLGVSAAAGDGPGGMASIAGLEEEPGLGLLLSITAEEAVVRRLIAISRDRFAHFDRDL